jgi:hypothetical protein
MLVAEAAATPRSWPSLAEPAGLGLGNGFQAVPFQCSIRV